MIAYRDMTRAETAREQFARVRRAARTGDALALLLEAGEMEQGIVDALRPARDGWGPVDSALRALSLAAARAFVHSGRLTDVQSHLDELGRLDLPREYRVKTPEGYAHYALDPGAYAEAAAACVRDLGAARAGGAVVLGIRSIGTSLSAVVAAGVGSTRTATIRVRGESGDRRVLCDDSLLALLRSWLDDAADVLLVDEGPGATGETFFSAASWLRSLGVPEARILLFPSHAAGMSMAPEARREWFQRARKYPPPRGDARVPRLAARLGLHEPQDLSGGRWREVVQGARGEAARASFERSKHLARDADGRPVLIRYAGAGRSGADAESRARRLAERGLGPEVLGGGEGYLALSWWEGPIAEGPEVVDAACDYLVARAAIFRTGEAADPEPLLRVLHENSWEALGRSAAELSAAEARVRALPRREAVIPDARLQRREWVRADGRIRKVDAVDHGDGLRWPGPADSAWDLAALAVEFGVEGEHMGEVVAGCARAGGETPGELAAAVRAYVPVYAACALGDCALSAREAFTAEDRRRLEAEAARYAAVLDRELRRAA